MLKYLLDEHVPPAYRAQLLRHAERQEPSLEPVVWMIGDQAAPPKGTLDPELLCWCEEQDFVLVTNNRRSMPGHLADHLAAGRHVPGIFVLKPELGIGRTADQLILIAFASLPDEFADRITYLPLL